MKKLIFALLCIALAASFAMAQDAEILKGDLIDNMCANANRNSLDSFVMNHTKACATMPACAASGYSIYADGKLVKLTPPSNAKVEDFLARPESTLKVAAQVTMMGDEASVVSIENQ